MQQDVLEAMAMRFTNALRIYSVEPLGKGNINDTYLATTGESHHFVLQRLNTEVFSRPQAVMHNTKVVTEHVHQRLDREPGIADRILQLPRLIPADTGDTYVLDERGACWRALTMVTEASTPENISSTDQAYEVGCVVGQFQRLIADIPCEELEDTLPGFHITPEYLQQYDRLVSDPEGRQRSQRSDDALWCHRFIEERRNWCSVLEDARTQGKLSLRPIHGDPRLANIMFDNTTGKAATIIDLDTVKPGLIHYDLGDCIRSCCNTATEETTDLGKVTFDTDLCDAIIRGYMSDASHFLTEGDRAHLYDCIRLLPFELGLRFFSDYLAGNVYFKVQDDNHNLRRAMVQFTLCADIEAKETCIRRIVDGD